MHETREPKEKKRTLRKVFVSQVPAANYIFFHCPRTRAIYLQYNNFIHLKLNVTDRVLCGLALKLSALLLYKTDTLQHCFFSHFAKNRKRIFMYSLAN